MSQELPRQNITERVVNFTAGDGLECNLINIRGERPADKGPVILVHGAGVRANIFRAPVDATIVDFLVGHGYDVWLENWRASIDFAPNRWTLDQAAIYDHPVAVKTVVKETGWDSVKAIIHCQGSTSFMMSAVAGLVPEVKTIIANAVTLHTIVPATAAIKIRVALPMVSPFIDYLDPQWGIEAPTVMAKLITLFVRMTHHECDNLVCRMASFTYGTGFPTLWRHENLNPETHDWLKSEFAHVPLRFFQQMSRCLSRGNLVSVEGKQELPEDFLADPPQTDARIAFFAGELNRTFLAEGQRKSFDYFNSYRKDYHSLHVLPEYAHLDIFMGKNASVDVFPLMVAELDKPN